MPGFAKRPLWGISNNYRLTGSVRPIIISVLSLEYMELLSLVLM